MFTSNYYGFWDYWNLYHKVTFDGPNRVIIVNDGESSVDIQTDIYSAWKEWTQLEKNLAFPVALSTIGGEPIGGGLFVGATFFLENGWRIRPFEADGVITFTGNIYTREEGDNPVTSTIGDWNIQTTFRVSALAYALETGGGGSSLTAGEVASAVWQYATSGSITPDTMGHHVFTQLATFAQVLATK